MMREFGKTVGDPSTNKEDAEVVDQKPFVIRGHHLKKFASLVKGPWGMAMTPQIMARGAKLMMEMLNSVSTLTPDGYYQIHQGYLEYSQDVVGTTEESANRFEEHIKGTFERFVSLPDDYPTELTEDVPDAMCEACTGGEHCRSLTFVNKIYGEGYAIIRDSQYLDHFLKIIDLLNLPEPVINYEQAHFSDAEPEQVRRVKTTLGVVKKVLKEESIFW